MAVAGGDETSLEFTPTWVVALVCLSIVFISVTVERLFHWAGQRLKKQPDWWPFIGASRKIKDELMLLGFISLLLAVFQTSVGKICISQQLANAWLPCKKSDISSPIASSFASNGTRGGSLLAMASENTDYCSQKGKVALLSVEAVHQLHIFIFVLATFHVVLCLLKILVMIIQWRNLGIYDAKLKADDHWQDRGNAVEFILLNLKQCHKRKETMILKNTVKSHKLPGFVESMKLSVQRQVTSITEIEYVALRVNFIEACHPKDPGNDFRKYIIGTLRNGFMKMIEISWYLWLFAVTFLLVNVAGWHALFWISFIPLILWLIVLFKLEFMISRLAKVVAEKHTQNEKESGENGAKEMVVEISDNDFWFGWPSLVGNLIHIVLFENSLQLTFFFFILFQYGFHSCIMGKVGFVVPRIVIGVVVQLMCTYRTIPLYAILKSQMHLKEKQWDKQSKISKHLEEYLLDEHKKKCLDDLDEIMIRLEEKGMDEEEEMQIMTWISELIDNIKNQRKEPNSPEEPTNVEPTRTDLRERSVGIEEV